MRVQLRQFYTLPELHYTYRHTYDSQRWSAHVERTIKTAQVLDAFAREQQSTSIADLSSGDGAIVGLSDHPWTCKVLGDFVSTGPIERTLLDTSLGHFDMFLLSETLEHLEDPDSVLAQIGVIADNLVLTTPYGETDTGNPEHYWGWDSDGVLEMLEGAGWTPRSLELWTPIDDDYYTFQIWTCTHDRA